MKDTPFIAGVTELDTPFGIGSITSTDVLIFQAWPASGGSRRAHERHSIPNAHVRKPCIVLPADSTRGTLWRHPRRDWR